MMVVRELRSVSDASADGLVIFDSDTLPSGGDEADVGEAEPRPMQTEPERLWTTQDTTKATMPTPRAERTVRLSTASIGSEELLEQCCQVRHHLRVTPLAGP